MDGLRGVAALAVLYLHQLGLFAGGGKIAAALAVDFFFMLSGFVLAHAYGAKLDNGLSWSRYMTARIIRLYPMLLLGIALGGLLSLVKASPHENLLTFADTLLMFPVGLLWGQSSFLFNGIIWSLFFELVASALFATRLRDHWSWVVPAAVVLILFAASFGAVGDLGVRGIMSFLGGFPRVAVPFAFGVIIYRLKLFERFPSVPLFLPAIILSALLLAPLWGWKYDLLCIFIAFPLLLCLGARAIAGKVGEILGKLSYPVYLVHWPLTQVVGFAVKRLTSDPLIIIPVTMATAIAFAWFALKLYDEPVRRWLRGLDLNRRADVGSLSLAVEHHRTAHPGGPAVHIGHRRRVSGIGAVDDDEV